MQPEPIKPKRWISLLITFLAGCVAGAIGLVAIEISILYVCHSGRTIDEMQQEVQQALLEKTLYDYLTTEGRSARGKLFANFMLGLDIQTSQGRHITETQLIDYAGPPDFEMQEGEVRNLWFYYTNSAPKDWAVSVVVRNGVAEQFGYGLAPSSVGKKAPSQENPAINTPKTK